MITNSGEQQTKYKYLDNRHELSVNTERGLGKIWENIALAMFIVSFWTFRLNPKTHSGIELLGDGTILQVLYLSFFFSVDG